MLGVLLTGIVFMQVEVLKLGASMGRSMNLAAELQSRNQLLRASVAQLSDDGRIERAAAKMGMIMPAPTVIKFVAPGQPGAVGKAISGIHAPQASGFLANLTTEEQAASGPLTPPPAALQSAVASSSGGASVAAAGATTTTTTSPSPTSGAATYAGAAGTTAPVAGAASTASPPASAATTPTSDQSTTGGAGIPAGQ